MPHQPADFPQPDSRQSPRQTAPLDRRHKPLLSRQTLKCSFCSTIICPSTTHVQKSETDGTAALIERTSISDIRFDLHISPHRAYSSFRHRHLASFGHSFRE